MRGGGDGTTEERMRKGRKRRDEEDEQRTLEVGTQEYETKQANKGEEEENLMYFVLVIDTW